MSSRLACNIEGAAYEGIDKGYPKPYPRIQFLLIRLLLLWIPPWSFGVWMHSFYVLYAYIYHGLSFTSYLWATCPCFLFSSLLPLFPVCFSLFMHVLLPLLVDGLRGAYFPLSLKGFQVKDSFGWMCSFSHLKGNCLYAGFFFIHSEKIILPSRHNWFYIFLSPSLPPFFLIRTKQLFIIPVSHDPQKTVHIVLFTSVWWSLCQHIVSPEWFHS